MSHLQQIEGNMMDWKHVRDRPIYAFEDYKKNKFQDKILIIYFLSFLAGNISR